MGTLIVVGVIVLVLVVFVGLVWLFVRLSRPVTTPPSLPAPTRTAANGPQRQNGAAGKKRKKASGRKRR